MRVIRFVEATKIRALFSGLILASITAYLLFIAGKDEILSGIDQTLIIISGMTTIAALAAFKKFIEEDKTSSYSFDEIYFNEAFASQSIFEGKADKSNNVTIINQTYQVSTPTPSPWDLSLNQLVGTDNSLALAKLRIEIERELRRIAYENGIDIAARPIGILGLAKELVTKEVLPTAWLGVLKEIVPVCTQAIHGLEVSDDMAASVVRVGGQLLEQLRLIPEKS